MPNRLYCYDTIRYDTIEEFNVDSKTEYSALSSTRSQKLKQMYKKESKTNKRQCPFNSVQVKIREGSCSSILSSAVSAVAMGRKNGQKS